jgi:phosphohistidine swiveling domain-containing protein
MKFDEARFQKFISEPGHSSSLKFPRDIILYQGITDTVAVGSDVLKIKDGEIKEASLLNGSPKISFAELEEIITLSEKLKQAGFPPLKILFTRNGVSARPVMNIPAIKKSDELVGLPASPGKITAISLVYPTQENPSGKIIVMKNSKDLPLLIIHKPSGIILEEGNLLSHASILAREAGIPAIVKVQNATQLIKSGCSITIDGALGSINIPTPR